MIKQSKKPTPLTEPQKPNPDECCGGGSCCPCVWDTYRSKRKAWQLFNEKLTKT